eukprot:CAMPEP_0119115894 /NCGR_PEP_ID=MMETSP1180-20130426/51988_1 /TAXON_ID=3052 ORGANISM="Chlamydomonas cf sp, Strain CCMP681" /NCGR_SAMPLE_ID=MMETSP1180 /ASSEMBLY_ACC=CAM_ASM_000741 /LENGTH=246 /DNA_ID=CAMNT_0007104997 /DNA_START=603 /DNA_END=1343 /DNA_ORIENTATION=+
MQFPKMRPGFLKVQELFANIVPHNEHSITLADFKQHSATLGLEQSKGLTKIFKLADVDGGHTIDATELVMVFTVIYLMDEEHSAIKFPEIKQTLDIVEKSFTYFDSSSDGFLDKKELLLALTSGTKVFTNSKGQAKKRAGAGDMLFDMLDVDKSGKVSFKEFLVGMQKLVMSELTDMDDNVELEGFLAEQRIPSQTSLPGHSQPLPAESASIQKDPSQQPGFDAIMPPPSACVSPFMAVAHTAGMD